MMLPEFFFALFEKNGMHLETILTNFINVRFKALHKIRIAECDL